MIEEGVNRLPVVDDEERLIGIVTRADLVRAFVRSDDEVEQEIREDVIRRTLWIEPDTIQVEVEGGEVRLSGEVETKGDAELIPTFVQRVPGVVAVLSKLRWRERTGTATGGCSSGTRAKTARPAALHPASPARSRSARARPGSRAAASA